MKITIINLQKKIPILPKRINSLIIKALGPALAHRPGEISVSFVSDKIIRTLNQKYLRKNTPTDVLAFDLSGDKKRFSADIIVSTHTAARNARVFKTTPIYESDLYVVHGLLHLLGCDDRTAKQRKVMQKKAEKILNADFRKSNADSRRYYVHT